MKQKNHYIILIGRKGEVKKIRLNVHFSLEKILCAIWYHWTAHQTRPVDSSALFSRARLPILFLFIPLILWFFFLSLFSVKIYK